MRIASYNVNGVNGRLAVLLRWLDDARPDIVCLQELKAPQDRFPAGALAEAGYEAAWVGQSRWNGVAILSRIGTPVVTRRAIPAQEEDGQARYVEAAVNGTILACLYAPNGNPRPGPKFDYKLEWLASLARHAAELFGVDAPVVLAGDYNIIPTDLDVYAPERWRDDALFAPEVRKVYEELQETGWKDALRMRHPSEPLYTFWKYWRRSFERDAGLRIDHFLLNPTAAARLADADVDRTPRGWEKTSDHAPAWIELDGG